MFGFTPEVLLEGAGAFFLVAFIMSALILIMSDGEFILRKMIFPVILILILASGVSYVGMSNSTEEDNRQANLPTEVAKLLNVDVEKVELATISKPEYDYTLKVDKDLVGVVYDDETEEIKYLISNDKYLYERGKK